jgi:hypothetical protein
MAAHLPINFIDDERVLVKLDLKFSENSRVDNPEPVVLVRRQVKARNACRGVATSSMRNLVAVSTAVK